MGVAAGVPMLGLDALSSSAYGPEAALTLLLPLGVAGLSYILPITVVILAILGVLFLSYRQTISAYPSGGGSYTVAKENLGEGFGLLAAAALMLDYILNVAVGISAGVGALVSAVPGLQSHTLGICLGVLALITLINLRGIRESGTWFAFPTYLFVGTLGIVLIVGLYQTVSTGGHPHPLISPPPLQNATEAFSLWLLLRAFASGCTAMTGVEAVSNGVQVFAEPAVKRAQQTLGVIVLLLALLLGGIAYLSHTYRIGAMIQDRPGYQSVLAQLTAATCGHGLFYYVTIAGVLAVLCLSANTSFADFPRLCRLIAEDDYLPHAFANKGRRLVYSIGISILTLLSGALLVLFGGITDRLIPLFAVGAFLAFTLSQTGMVRHWMRQPGRHTGKMFINGLGALATGAALIVVLIAKFVEGAWITVLLVPTVLYFFTRVKRHYEQVYRETTCDRPIDLSDLRPPVVVMPITGWNIVAEKGLHFALRVSPDIIAVHISLSDAEHEDLRNRWTSLVAHTVESAGLPAPRLVSVPSPYRQLISPLLDFINREVEKQHPDRQIAVVIPEMVELNWFQYLLHNHRAMVLKAALLWRGDSGLTIVNVPWHLRGTRRKGAPP